MEILKGMGWFLCYRSVSAHAFAASSSISFIKSSCDNDGEGLDANNDDAGGDDNIDADDCGTAR